MATEFVLRRAPLEGLVALCQLMPLEQRDFQTAFGFSLSSFKGRGKTNQSHLFTLEPPPPPPKGLPGDRGRVV